MLSSSGFRTFAVVLAEVVWPTFEHLKCWLFAWKPAIIPGLMGIVYLGLPHSILTNLIFAVLYGIIILVEFLLFPKIAGSEYCSTIYPIIIKFVRKFNLR